MDGSAQRPLAELLESVAAHTPAPGGGSAAAWTAALGAALVEMAALYAGADGPAAQAATLRAALLTIGETELRSYEPVLVASRLPRDDPARAERLGSALAVASESPLAIARAAAEVADLGRAVAVRSTPALAGDAVSGVLLAEAACRAAARIVEINLAGDGRNPRVTEAGLLADRAAAARAEVIDGA